MPLENRSFPTVVDKALYPTIEDPMIDPLIIFGRYILYLERIPINETKVNRFFYIKCYQQNLDIRALL